MIPSYEILGKKTKLTECRKEILKVVPSWAWSKGRICLGRRMREFSELMVNILYIDIKKGLHYTDVCICLNSSNEQLRCVLFIIYKFYCKKNTVNKE